MTSPPATRRFGDLSVLFLIAALVVFIIAALLGFGVFGDVTLLELGALIASGLACSTAAGLV